MSKDGLAKLRVEVAIITFGPTTVKQDFVTVGQFEPPTLEVTGDTPMGTAINLALDKIELCKQAYKQNGISYYRPWVFLIADGIPNPDEVNVVQSAAQRVCEAESQKKATFFSEGVEGADMGVLSSSTIRCGDTRL